jgi:hypothetical protein
MEPLRDEQIATIESLLPDPTITLRQIGACAETTYAAVLHYIDAEFGLGRCNVPENLTLPLAPELGADAKGAPPA